MTISAFEIFSIGIGPSSSHTMGPMIAAKQFTDELASDKQLTQVHRLSVELYGSLALTGKGHATDRAILSGLEGHCPETVDPDSIIPTMERILKEHKLTLNGKHAVDFHYGKDLIFHYKTFLEKHSNAMRITAVDKQEHTIKEVIYYSIGGGFIVTDDNFHLNQELTDVKYHFDTSAQLLKICNKHKLSIPQVMMENEKSWHSEGEIKLKLQTIADVMFKSIDRGCKFDGVLPGGLGVKRRAPDIFKKLNTSQLNPLDDQTDVLNWVNMFAIAVNEENAVGSRVVTAPTNGSAGVIPAVLRYYLMGKRKNPQQDIYDFLLTAAAIAILYKKGASFSAAEVGCQGEIGVASSMAAGALAAVLGGSIEQIENAAEIAMEHHLGMTCDPIKGLVQIPCIERNAMGAVQAVNAARLALMGDGQHHVSLDKVIATMLQTGIDMQSQYKETSLGGLAANHPEC